MIVAALQERLAFITGPLEQGSDARGEWTLAPIPHSIDIKAEPLLKKLYAWPGPIVDVEVLRAKFDSNTVGDLLRRELLWWLDLILPPRWRKAQHEAVWQRLYLTLRLARGECIDGWQQPDFTGYWAGSAGAAYAQERRTLNKVLIQAGYYAGLFREQDTRFLRSQRLEQDWELVRNIARGWKRDEFPLRYLRSLYCPLYLSQHDWKEFFGGRDFRRQQDWLWLFFLVEGLAQTGLYDIGAFLNKNRDLAKCRF